MRRFILVACVLAVATVSFARTVYYADNTEVNYWRLFDSEGKGISANSVAKDSGFDLVTGRLATRNSALSDNLDAYSWTIAGTNVTNSMTGPWCDGSGAVTIGAGGLTMAANNAMRFGHMGGLARVKLSESQTWRGPDSGAAEFYIGCDGYWNGYYWNATIAALNDIDWTLDGRIKVFLCATNNLSNVDVTVNSGARIILVEKWNNQIFGGALGAKTLTLRGDRGASSEPILTIGGGKNPDGAFMAPSYAPSSFGNVTLAPKVYLVDGASVAGKKVDYSVSELFVSGGDSSFSGDVTFTADTAIDIAADATLSFSGHVSSAAGCTTELTGDGKLVFEAATVDARLSGDGNIVFDVDDECVFRGDLSAFTGTVHVSSGTLLLHPDTAVNGSISFSAAQGASYRRLEDGDFTDFVKDGREFFRSADGIAHPYFYMPKITGNTTWPAAGKLYYVDADGVTNQTDWIDGGVLCFEQLLNAGLANGIDVNVCGIVRKPGSGGTTTYFDNSKVLAVGSRGIEFCAPNQGMYIWKHQNYFQLSDSQTWKGPDAETFGSGYARICAGGSWTYLYPTGSLTPAKDDLTLTLAGNFILSIYYPSNDFSKANVVVKSPALLHLTSAGGRKDAWKTIYGRLNAKTLTFDGGVGMYFGGKTIASTGVGSPAEISPTRVAQKLILKNGATLTATAVTDWTGTGLAVAQGSTGNVSGTFVLHDALTALDVPAGSLLDMTGGSFRQAQGVKAGFAVSGAGTVKFAMDNLSLIDGQVTFDGSALEITGAGAWTRPLAGASALTVSSSGLMSVPDSALAGFDGPITVAAGTLVLDSASSIPAGRKVCTSGSGRLMLLDWTGFDAQKHMEGTANYGNDAMVVTDVPVENTALSVGSGETLQIFGSGLKRSSTVSLADGSSIVFHKPATVYAAVTNTGSVTVRSYPGAEGEFAGVVALRPSSTNEIYAEGGLTFSGGLRSDTATYRHRKGRVLIKTAESKFYKGYPQFYEGTMLITNANLAVEGCTFRMDMEGQTGDMEVRILERGSLTFGNNGIANIGRSNDFESRLVIDGGTLQHGTPDSFRMNYNGTGRSVIDFIDGTLFTRRRIWSGHDMSSEDGYARFIWRGGTMNTGTGTYAYQYRELFMGTVPGSSTASDTTGVEFIVEGTNCVLDLGNFKYPDAISNFTGKASRMIGAPGAVLTVKGRKDVDCKMTLVGFEPNGMALDLNPDPKVDVEIAGDGEPMELGWVAPGTNGTVTCIGTPTPLAVNYVVRSGGTFENSYTNGWNSGFASVAVNDLVFGEGSVYRVYTGVDGFSPLSLAGVLSLPAKMTLAVDRSAASVPAGEGQTLVSAAGGVEGECAWTFKGVSKFSSLVYAGENALLFDYKPKATFMLVR